MSGNAEVQLVMLGRAPSTVLDCSRWGLPPDAAGEAADRLCRIWERYHGYCTTKTHDTGEYGWVYFRGVLTARVPQSTLVYTDRPTVAVPEKSEGTAGPAPQNPQVVSEGQPIAVRDLLAHPDLALRSVDVWHTERGMLTYDCAARQVFVLGPDDRPREEWFFIRREPDETFSFAEVLHGDRTSHRQDQ